MQVSGILSCDSGTSRHGVQGNSLSQQDLPHRAPDSGTVLDWLDSLTFLDMPFNTVNFVSRWVKQELFLS